MPSVPSSPAPRSWRWVRLAGVGAVLVAAVAVRLWSAWHARLSPEEASFWNTAVAIAHAESFPALGHSVSGTRALHPGPLFFWIIAVSQVLVTSPFVANAFVSLFALFGAIMLARTVAPREVDAPVFAGSTTGALLFLLVLASPWWVVYSNSTWPSYLVTGVAACFVAALLRVTAKERSRAAAPLGFLLVAGFQIHLSLLHFWPLALAVLIVCRPRLDRRWLLGGVLLAVACYLPYALSELRTHFSNTRLLLAKSQGGERDLRTLAGLYLYFLGFPTTDISYLWQHGFWSPFDHFRFWRGDGGHQTTVFFRSVGATSFLWTMQVVSWLVSVTALFVGAFRLVRGWRRGVRRPQPMTLVYLVGLADIALFYGLSGKGGYAHYVGVILPLAFFPVASLLRWLLRFRFGRPLVAAYLLAFSVGGLLVLRGYYRVDSRLSAPQSARVVAFILARAKGADGQPEPLELQFGFSPAWTGPYQILARRLHHASLTFRPQAPHRFFVGPRNPGDPPHPADPDRLDLETIFVTER
ncbi:MAG TPA: hypothetical protein VGP07_14445 [Polyangia bacterium]